MVRHLVGKRALCLCPGILLLLGVQGCLATRGWVTEQMAPLEGRVSNVETRLSQTDAKADQALDRLNHLRLEAVRAESQRRGKFSL